MHSITCLFSRLDGCFIKLDPHCTPKSAVHSDKRNQQPATLEKFYGKKAQQSINEAKPFNEATTTTCTHTSMRAHLYVWVSSSRKLQQTTTQVSPNLENRIKAQGRVFTKKRPNDKVQLYILRKMQPVGCKTQCNQQITALQQHH